MDLPTDAHDYQRRIAALENALMALVSGQGWRDVYGQCSYCYAYTDVHPDAPIRREPHDDDCPLLAARRLLGLDTPVAKGETTDE